MNSCVMLSNGFTKYSLMYDRFDKQVYSYIGSIFFFWTGKSGIHGYGIFAKQPHRAGDMVPSIART